MFRAVAERRDFLSKREMNIHEGRKMTTESIDHDHDRLWLTMFTEKLTTKGSMRGNK